MGKKKKQTVLDKIESISKSISYILVPIILAVITWILQSTSNEKTLGKEYVALSVGILQNKNTEESLKSWAVDVINAYSKIPFSKELKTKVLKGEATIPNYPESSQRTLEKPEYIETVAGKVEIIKNRNEYLIIFRNEILFRSGDHIYIGLEEKFNKKDSTVLIMYFDLGGSGTIPSYFVIEIFKTKKPVVTSNDIESSNGTFEASMSNEVITMNLGFEDGLSKYAIYKNGKVEIKKDVVTNYTADDKTCKRLYELHKDVVNSKVCQIGLYDLGGRGLMVELNDLYEDPRLNMDLLEAISKESCVDKVVWKYNKFKSKVCKGAGH